MVEAFAYSVEARKTNSVEDVRKVSQYEDMVDIITESIASITFCNVKRPIRTTSSFTASTPAEGVSKRRTSKCFLMEHEIVFSDTAISDLEEIGGRVVEAFAYSVEARNI